MITEDEIFEYLTFGGTFGRVFRLFFDRLDVFMGISLVFSIPYIIFTVTLLTAEMYGNDFVPGYVLMSAFDFLVYELACVIGQGAISIAVAEIYIGRQPGWGTCLKRAWTVKWALVCSSLLLHAPLFVLIALPAFWFFILVEGVRSGILLFVFLLVCVGAVGASYWYSGLILSGPAIAIENFQSPIKGLKRSWELCTGSRCYVLTAMLCLFVGRYIISSLLRLMFGILAGSFLDILITVFYLPLQVIIETVLYLNLRIGRESLNNHVLMGDLMTGQPPSSRFRNDDPAASGYVPTESLDYRHVPLMDDDEIQFSNASATPIA